MPKAVKWILAIIAGMFVVIIIAVLLAPVVFNLEKYKPQIEAEAAKAIGRPVTLGGKIEPSVFPWIGISISDVHLGNPQGFEEKDLVSLGLFEMRIKLLPLLSGDIDIKRFILKDTRIVIEKTKNGRSNLDGLGQPGPSQTTGKPPKAQSEPAQAESPLPIKSFTAEEFAILNASVLMIDHAAGSRQEIKDINLTLTDLSLDKPVGLTFGAVLDEKPISVTGTVGPVGLEIGNSPVALDLSADLIKQITIKITGLVKDLKKTPTVDMQLEIEPFSPRKLLAQLNQPLPVETADPDVLKSVSARMKVAGGTDRVAIQDGQMKIDDSTLTFQAQAQAFDKPDLKLSAALDRIDLDRYLPPPAEKTAEAKPADTEKPKSKEKTDYTPLRKLILDAQIKVGQLKAKNASMANILVKVTAKDGIIRLDPLGIDLYRGHVATTGTINVQTDQPRSALGLSINAVQAGPLIKDVMAKEIIEGALSADIDLKFSGDQTEQIRKTLDGKGELKFNDGALVGVDLADMVRNVQSAFLLSEKPQEKPRTDFSELVVPFAVSDGIANLNSAKLSSPLLRVTAGGQADLIKEALNIRVEPKFVGTLKGQGDTAQRSGILVPVLITGSFAKPQFTPDLKSLLNQQLPDKEAIQKMVPPKEDLQKDLEKKAQDLFKGLPFGQPKKGE